MKKPVSQRALLARINRRLVKAGEHGQQMKSCSPRSRWHDDLGNYYIIDLETNAIAASGIDDLEAWARSEMDGILKPFETVAD